jgi:hypothetical protein
MAEAVCGIVDTSTGRISRYSWELHDAYVERYGTAAPAVVLVQGRFRLR